MLGDSIKKGVFLSTPSLRRATELSESKKGDPMVFLSTPSLRRATTYTAAIRF